MTPTQRVLAEEKQLRGIMAKTPNWQEVEKLKVDLDGLLDGLGVLRTYLPQADKAVRDRFQTGQDRGFRRQVFDHYKKLKPSYELVRGVSDLLNLLYGPLTLTRRREDFIVDSEEALKRIRTNFPQAEPGAKQYALGLDYQKKIQERATWLTKLKKEQAYGSRVDHFEDLFTLESLLFNAMKAGKSLRSLQLQLPPGVQRKLKSGLTKPIAPSWEVSTMEISPAEQQRISTAATKIFSFFSSKAAGTKGLMILRTAVVGLSKPGAFQFGMGEADIRRQKAGGINKLQRGIGMISLDSGILTEKAKSQEQARELVKILQNEVFELGWQRAYGSIVASPKFQAISFVVSDKFVALLAGTKKAKLNFQQEYAKALKNYKSHMAGKGAETLVSRAALIARLQAKKKTFAVFGGLTAKIYEFETAAQINEFYDLIDAMLDFASGGTVTKLSALPP